MCRVQGRSRNRPRFAPFATGMAPKPGQPKPRKDVELEELKEQLAAMQAQLAKLVKES